MLSTPRTSITDLLVQISAGGTSHEQAGMDTYDLLQAIVDEGDGLAAELLRELELEAPEPAEEAAREDSHLREIVQVAHQHAVMFESDRIGADHVLIAIVALNEGRAAEAIGDESRGRIWDELIVGFGYEGDALTALSLTGREALALAWSQALAVGRDAIEVEDLLRGIAAPGWTIGARALASLGWMPQWAPTLWRDGVASEPYRRVPFDERLRQALRAARETAAELGLDYVGTEHLLQGIARTPPGLATFLGRRVSDDQTRSAIAIAISSAEEAQDAEARRRGWRPEQDREPDMVDRWIEKSWEVVEHTAEGSRESDPELRCWPGLIAAILLNEDEDLQELLEDMLLKPAEAVGLGQGVEDLPLSAAVARAEEQRPRGELEPVDLIVATISTGSQRVLTGLDQIGLTANEVRAQLREWQLRRDDDTFGAPSLLAVTGINLLFGAITSAALLQVVVSEGAWWKLVFLPLVWAGYPNHGPVGCTLAAAFLGFVVSPLVGALHLLGIPAEIAQTRVERQAIWSRTGVRLSLREQRCVTRRAQGEMGRMIQGVRQIVRSSLPARLRGRARG